LVDTFRKADTMSPMAAETTKRRRARRRYDDEFKAQAVRLVLDEGQSVTGVARDLDLTRTALHAWVERAQADRSGGKTGLTSAERDELVRLRKARFQPWAILVRIRQRRIPPRCRFPARTPIGCRTPSCCGVFGGVVPHHAVD
jgi:transposase